MRILLAGAVLALTLSACGGDDPLEESSVTTAPPTTVATATFEPTLSPTEDAKVTATQTFRAAASTANDDFLAWATGGDGQTAASSSRAAAQAAEALADVAAADRGKPGAAQIAAAASDYTRYFERQAVLAGQGETAYAQSEPAEGDIDCFKERAAKAWAAGAGAYLGEGERTPPIDGNGVCDKGYGR